MEAYLAGNINFNRIQGSCYRFKENGYRMSNIYPLSKGLKQAWRLLKAEKGVIVVRGAEGGTEGREEWSRVNETVLYNHQDNGVLHCTFSFITMKRMSLLYKTLPIFFLQRTLSALLICRKQSRYLQRAEQTICIRCKILHMPGSFHSDNWLHATSE